MRLLKSLAVALAGYIVLVAGAQADKLAISAEDFNCMLDMQAVRGFYVDNLIEGKLEDTLAIAKA